MAALLALALALGSGCATWLGLPPRLAVCPGPLPSTRELPPGDWLVRERVRVVGGDVDVGLEVAAEKRGDRLVVVAFHALGAKAFSLVQRGDDLEVESHLGRALPVPPRNVLRDLYAAGLGADPAVREHGRVRVERPECGYDATFVRVERRTLNAAASP